MRDTLVLKLPSRAGAPLSWTLRSAPGELSVQPAETASGPLDDVLPLLRDKRVIMLVPTEQVLLTHVELATRQTGKLLQAVPYALEEQLAEDVDRLHFALGSREGNVTPVAVVSRAVMTEWLEPLADAGIQPDIVMPDVLALPLSADADATVLIEDTERALVRTGTNSGFACPVALLPSLLNKATDEPMGLRTLIVEGAQPPDTLGLSASEAPLPDALSALPPPLPANRFNLLQGEFAPRRSFDAWIAAARWPAAIAATWLIAATASLALHNASLAADYDAVSEATLAEFQQAFPDQTRIVDLRAQTAQALNRMRNAGPDAGFLALFTRSSAALAKVSALQLQSVQFREGSLYLNLTGTDLQALETLRGEFDTIAELALDVQSAQAGSDGVQIRLKVDARS